MNSRFIECNGKLFEIQVIKSEQNYINDILDNGKKVASVSLHTPASDEIIKQTIQGQVPMINNLELAAD